MKQRRKKGKLVVAVTISPGQKVVLTLYLEMHQRNRPHGTTSSK